MRYKGLPELKLFQGSTIGFVPSKWKLPPYDSITSVMRELAHFANGKWKSKLENFELMREQCIDDAPKHETFLFTEPKSPNLTHYKEIKFWNYEKNGKLDPRNLNPKSNAYIWLTCHEGASLIRRIDKVRWTRLKDNRPGPKDICPFIYFTQWHMRTDRCDGRLCKPAYDATIKALSWYKNHAFDDNEGIGCNTCLAVKGSPEAQMLAIRNVADDPQSLMSQFDKAFENLFSWRLIVRTADDLVHIKAFNTYHGNKQLILFNWHELDNDEVGRGLLIRFADELLKRDMEVVPVYKEAFDNNKVETSSYELNDGIHIAPEWSNEYSDNCTKGWSTSTDYSKNTKA